MRKLGVLLILLGVLLMIPLTAYGEDQIDDGKYTIYSAKNKGYPRYLAPVFHSIPHI